MMDSIHRSMAHTGLVRSDDRLVAGVCAGLAAKFGTDPGLMRLLMVLLLLLPGSQLFVYPLLWFVMPDRRRAAELTGAAPASPIAPVDPQDRIA